LNGAIADTEKWKRRTKGVADSEDSYRVRSTIDEYFDDSNIGAFKNPNLISNDSANNGEPEDHHRTLRDGSRESTNRKYRE